MTTFLSGPRAPALPRSNMVAPYDPILMSTTAAIVANTMCAVRVVIPYDGVMHGLAVYIATQSGNLDLGVYDTAATTRTRKFNSFSISCGPAGAYQTVDPNLPVKRGEHYDLAVAFDNAVAVSARTSANAAGQMQLPAGFMNAPLGGKNWMGWKVAASFTLPATVAESAFAISQTNPWLGCYISPDPA